MNPIVIDMTQMRLVIELAAQQAGRRELEYQLQHHFPGDIIIVNDFTVTVEITNTSSIRIDGHPVVLR